MFTTSETIKDLEVLEGRRLLHEFFHDRRVKNTFELRTLLECWRLCRVATDLQFADGRRIRFETSLGFKLGTRVFAEEILGVYYFNFIQGWVYFGAMLVLVAVGGYLAGLPVWVAWAGFGLEAFFLLLLAIVTAYAPTEDGQPGSGRGAGDALLNTMSTSMREMTNSVSDLFRLVSQTDIRQDVLLTRLTENIAKIQGESVRQYSEHLQQTNTILHETRALLQNRFDALLEAQREQARIVGDMARMITSAPQNGTAALTPVPDDPGRAGS